MKTAVSTVISPLCTEHNLNRISQSVREVDVNVSEMAVMQCAQTTRHQRQRATTRQLDQTTMMMIMTLMTAANVSQLITTANTLNALTVLRDWLDCNTTGQHSKFNLIADLDNFVVSCGMTQQIRD